MKLPGVFDVKVLDNGTVALTQKPTEQMTGDELAARLYAEQGYHVLNGNTEFEIGHIVACNSGAYPMKTPLRIVGISNREEFDRQQELSARITGTGEDVSNWIPFAYFYRVEAAD